MNIVNREPITQGWSGDKKYRITDEKGTRYLLRISDIAQRDAKQSGFEMMQRVAALGIPMCRPIEFGVCEEGVYTILSWIDGEGAEERIPRLSGKEQYNYGLEAGRILRRIHSIPAPLSQEDWDVRFNRKADTKIQKYEECPIKYPKGQAFIDYINANRHLLNGRPQVYQHGDYHIGNMMIDREGKLFIIDFDRSDHGDPWEEFNRIVWCAQKSAPFASGMVDGYFDGVVPMDFWKLLALYISSNTLSSIYWAIPFGESQVNTMLNQAKEVLAWYHDMTDPVPTWYQHEGDAAFQTTESAECTTEKPDDLQLYIPRPEDGWFYVKMMSDAETMAYNAPWFPPDGCIPEPEEEWQNLQAAWIGKEPERFYAFLQRKSDGAFVGDVNYHRNPERDWCDMGIVIFAPERGKGYGKQGLRLLLDRAFRVDGVSRLHNDFETTRDAAYRIHKAAGFRETGLVDGIIQLELTREEYLQDHNANREEQGDRT